MYQLCINDTCYAITIMKSLTNVTSVKIYYKTVGIDQKTKKNISCLAILHCILYVMNVSCILHVLLTYTIMQFVFLLFQLKKTSILVFLNNSEISYNGHSHENTMQTCFTILTYTYTLLYHCVHINSL